ncbi:TolC family protein [Treponema parvum]|uniref:TolC family protein n=1 Tax=Treponema parvum TaxID=138851 RepID=A0A975F5H0_9SPIR|nr:TolC family protein [Treponema parvum]QTQ14990.1 TolC family protein [Treponema parvum]
MKNVAFTGFFICFMCCSIKIRSQIVFNSAEDAVVFAKQNSRERIIEKEMVLANMKKTKINIQEYIPQLSVSLSESNSVSFNASDSRTKSLQFSLNQNVFNPARKMNYELANIQAVYAYKENLQSAKTFESEIINDYYNCLIASRQLLIKTELYEKTQDELKIMEARAFLGMLLQTDYLEFLTSALKIQNEMESARRSCKVQERILKLATGIEETTELKLADELNPEALQTELEPFTDKIWNIVKNSSIELQKEDVMISFSRKRQQVQDAWYLPVFTVKPSVSFSGEDYPLSNPRYSVQMSFSFQNIPFAPLSVSNNYTYTRKKLTGVSNSADSSFPSGTTYFTDQKISDLTLLQQQIKRQNYEKQLFSALYELLVTHDDYLRSIQILQRTLELQQERLEFSKLQTDQGMLKPIDYVEQLIELSNTKISLIRTTVAAVASERSISVMTGMSFKELINACR